MWESRSLPDLPAHVYIFKPVCGALSMKAIQFNLCFDAYFAAPLIGVGFVRDKNNFVLEDGQTQLVIKRWHGKFSNACQCTNLSLLLRHKFLRNLEKEQVSGYPKLISDYPVKEKYLFFVFQDFHGGIGLKIWV